MIETTDWSFLQLGTVNEAADRFVKHLQELIKCCIPSRTVTIRSKDKPWYNSEISSYSRKRDLKKTKAIRLGKETDWANYKSLRNTVYNMKKHAKEGFKTN